VAAVRIRTLALGAGLVALVVVYQHDQGSAAAAAGGALRPGTVPAAYAGIINDAGRTCPQITPALLAAQINQESGFDPRAVSDTNAQGIAQFEPDTAASNHVDPWNPDSAIHGMARLDCSYVKSFGSVTLALAAYNGGPGIVDHWQQVDQTNNYVHSILAAAPRYAAPAPAPSPPPTGGGPGELRKIWDLLRTTARSHP
jgi:soluble lytic murein transglycosylase-like protein